MRLYRNREFVLLQAGQLLSALGSSFTTIAYPLLVLALTHSPAKAGLVSCARYLPAPVVGLAAGIASDRWNRKRVMIAADAVRALAIGALAAVVAFDPLYWPIPLLAFVEGAGDAFFTASSTAALRAVVPGEQLAAAVSVQQGRVATVGLAGPPVGGALFGIARFVPFLADAVSYTFSTVSLLLMRTPFQQPRERTPLRIRAELAEGFRFLWRQPFVRVTSFMYAIGNFTDPAALFVLVVVAHRQGLSGARIGLLLALFSAALLVGATLSPFVRARRSVPAIIRTEQYCATLMLAYVVWPSVYVLIASVIPLGLAIPITDSVVITRRLELTPDALLGRVESVRATIARVAAPLGPLSAGLLLSVASARATMAFFSCFGIGLAAYATFSRAIES